MPILTIARLTILESARRRLLLILIVLTLITIALTGWGFTKLVDAGASSGQPLTTSELRIVTSQILIMVGFMFSGVIALTAIMAASLSVAGDIESGVMLALLPRPIRRVDFLLGKWLGLGFVLAIYTSATVAIELAVAQWTTGFVTPHPFLLAAYLIGEGLVLLTLGLLLSTRFSGIAGGISAVILFLMTWMGGIAGGIGIALHNDAIAQVGTVSRLILPSDGLWRGAVYSLEPPIVLAQHLGRIAAGNPFYAPDPPSAAYIGWVLIWLLAVMALAAVSLRMREV